MHFVSWRKKAGAGGRPGVGRATRLVGCRKHRLRAGVAAVELAITLPLLLLIFAIAVDYARIYQCMQVLSMSARNGAMFAADINVAQSSPYDTVEEVVRASAGAFQNLISFQAVETTDRGGQTCVDVTVSCPFDMVLSLPGVARRIDLSETVRMRRPRAVQPEPES